MTLHALLAATILALVGRPDGSYLDHVSSRPAPRAWAAEMAWYIQDASSSHGVDPILLTALYYHESRFDERAVSRRGARGVSQINPRAWPRTWLTIVSAPHRHRVWLQVWHGTRIFAHYQRACGRGWRAVSAYRSGRCPRRQSAATRLVMDTYRSVR